MATALNQLPRKRTSSGQDKYADRGSGKRRKETVARKDEKKKSSKSSKKDSKSHRSSVKQDKSTSKATSPGLRVRSVTELAALVASGAVRVPKGLQHYVADRSELLDQVFNILTPTEVEEMLPDVLKGVKMRQLKRACLLKLQEMCEEEILSVIQPGGPAPEPTLDSTLMGILGQSSTGTSRDRDFQPVTPVNEDAQSSTPENKDVTNDKAETGTGATPVCQSNRATAERESVADRHLETRCSHQECVRDVWDKEIEMSTSDVSEDECDDKDSKPSMELVVTGAVAPPCGSGLTTGFEHGAETLSVNPNNLDVTCSSLVNTNSDPSKQPGFKIDLSNSDKEEPAKDIPQAGQLLEMEMRRRALESALRQVKEPTADHTPSDNESQVYSRRGCESLTQPMSEGDKNKLVITSPDSKELLGDNNEEVPVHYRQDGSSPTEEVVVECVTPEESSDSQQLLMERRLREKLLRSLVDHK